MSSLRNDFNERTLENAEITNKLLLEMVKNQKASIKNLTKLFIITIVCYSIILISMIIGFFIYESQFDIVEGQYETYEYTQEGEGENVEFNNGDVYKDNATHNDYVGD